MAGHANARTKWTAYDLFQKKSALKDYYSSINHNNIAAIKSLNIGQIDMAIDLASGCGTSTYPLRQVARTVIGVDSSKYLIGIARDRNTDPKVRFICKRAEEFCLKKPADLVSASWLLNYFHTESTLKAILQKIHSLLAVGGCVSFVVPSAAFLSPQVQRFAREVYEFEVAPLADSGCSATGVFSFGDEWIKTTVWQPLHLMRLCSPWFELREWDVKGTLVRDKLLPDMNIDPPYTVLYGKKKEKC